MYYSSTKFTTYGHLSVRKILKTQFQVHKIPWNYDPNGVLIGCLFLINKDESWFNGELICLINKYVQKERLLIDGYTVAQKFGYLLPVKSYNDAGSLNDGKRSGHLVIDKLFFILRFKWNEIQLCQRSWDGKFMDIHMYICTYVW